MKGMTKGSKWMGGLAVLSFVIMGWAGGECWPAEGKYPSRPIQVVIPYQPGATDMALRPFVEKLQEYLGQPMPFVYKPGGAAVMGGSFVARANPDGYTLLGATPSSVILGPLTKEGVDYTMEDFVPLCRLSSSPFILAVKADSRWKTLKDIVEEAKKYPDKLSYSTTGVLGTGHIPVAMFLKQAGISMTHVPCPGMAPAITALLGGHVDMTSSSMGAVVPHLRSGALRAVGVFMKQRLKEFPDVPTFSELGYPVAIFVWYGLMGPKGTREEVVKVIYGASKKVMENQRPFIEDRMAKSSLTVDFLSPEEFANELRSENEAMKNIVKELMKADK